MDWQTSIALLVVLGAAVMLVRHLWALTRGSGAPACGSCAKCDVGKTPSLVPLESLAADRPVPDDQNAGSDG